MKKINLTLCFFITVFIASSQTDWQLTGSTPEGGGITDILLRESTGDLFAVTASYGWPNGDKGGIRRSSNEGDTWTNIFDAFTARTIREESDGNLYASVWPYPQNEGLYRSSNNGDTWDLLVTVPELNNIFSSALKENSPNNIIFAGTRLGVYRSLDNGATWNYSNTGMPAESWVRTLEVGPNGTIAAGTTNGLFVSFNDGDSWSKVTGEFENETVVSLLFETTSTASKDDEVNLYAGTANGLMLMSSFFVAYSIATMVHNFNGEMELTRMKYFVVTTAFVYTYYMISIYAASGGNFFLSFPGINNWQQFTTGLPTDPISMFSAIITTSLIIHMYLGVFGNTNGGAKVYKSSSDQQTGYDQIPFTNTGGLQLMQNFPNPFSGSTRIGFNLEKSGETLLELYDWTGRKIRTIINEYRTQGTHHVNLTNTGLNAGMYYYTLESGQNSVTKKLIIQ